MAHAIDTFLSCPYYMLFVDTNQCCHSVLFYSVLFYSVLLLICSQNMVVSTQLYGWPKTKRIDNVFVLLNWLSDRIATMVLHVSLLSAGVTGSRRLTCFVRV